MRGKPSRDRCVGMPICPRKPNWEPMDTKMSKMKVEADDFMKAKGQ